MKRISYLRNLGAEIVEHTVVCGIPDDLADYYLQGLNADRENHNVPDYADLYIADD